jgi:hypothetical protein
MEDTQNWSNHMKRVMAKALATSMALGWTCGRGDGLRPRSAATLWQAIVRPMLEYAAEIFAGDIPAQTITAAERIQTDFARAVLGLKNKQGISNDFLRAEMGMERIQARWQKLRLGYWRRVNLIAEPRTMARLARIRKTHAGWGGIWAKNNWMQGTRILLMARGLEAHWLDPQLCTQMSKDEWKFFVYEAVEQSEDRLRENRLLDMKTGARYARLKHWGPVSPDQAKFPGEMGRRGALVHERYLDTRWRHGTQMEGRKLKLMCRAGCLPVLSRVGREVGWSERLTCCMMCNTGELETPEHFIMTCPAYTRHRALLLVRVNTALAHTRANVPGFETDLSLMDQAAQQEILLGRSTGHARTDDAIDMHFQRYLKRAWRARKHVTKALDEVLDRDDAVQ